MKLKTIMNILTIIGLFLLIHPFFWAFPIRDLYNTWLWDYVLWFSYIEMILGSILVTLFGVTRLWSGNPNE